MPGVAASECCGVPFELSKTSEFDVDLKFSSLCFNCPDFRYEGAKIYLYTGDTDVTPKQIISKCRNNFNIQVDPKRLEFVFLNKRKWVEAEKYPIFTLLGQSIGSIVLGFEALLKFQPDIYLDTMGKLNRIFINYNWC